MSKNNFNNEILFYYMIFIILFCISSSIKGEDKTLSKEDQRYKLFTLERVNYKNYKILYFDVFANSKTCQIKKEAPLDIYYLHRFEKENPRIDLSFYSKKYFGARDVKFHGDHRLTFTFYALEQIKSVWDKIAQIEVVGEKKDDKCFIQSFVYYEKKKLNLEHITLRMKLLFGLIIGLKDFQFTALDLSMKRHVFCPLGECTFKE